MPTTLEDDLRRAMAHVRAGSSDYDLNPDTVLPENRKLRPAGVLIPVLVWAGAPRLILTKRSSALKHHPGQIAFPGGKQDPEDATIIDTGLREAQEEIGLDPGLVRILGTLPAHETVTSFSVTPILGLIDAAFEPVPEPGEVDEVFSVPLHHVLTPGNFSIQSRRWRGAKRSYYTVPFGPYYIWGATARILHGLAEGWVTR